jgi:acyl-coenzyme A synthetase/AMP-(fatty) acid ligase
MPADLKSEAPAGIIHRWRKAGVGVLQGHPSLLDMIMPAQHAPDPVLSIRHLIMGGEPLKAGWLAGVRRWLPGLHKITHNYSSTETMLIACRSYAPDEIERMRRIPAGFPAPGKQIHILDEAGEEMTSGMVGEISVTSHFIGSEMDGQDGAVRLFRDPVSGHRTWCTRDLGRWLPDGSIEHMGRADRQMKINGLRIDPVFIEQCMEAQEGVERSRVFTINDEESGQRLVAVFEGAAAISTAEIRSMLGARLPPGHIPSGIFRIDRIPLTQRGKPDYGSLERFVQTQWEGRREDATAFTPENDDAISRFLQETWSTLLPARNCDPLRSVFDQGADSVMLLKMISLITDKYELRLTIAFMLEQPTMNMQAAAIRNMMRTSSLPSNAIGQEDLSLHFF